jgi:predicted RNase H-like HicB family nuclease
MVAVMTRPTYRVDALKRGGWWLLTSPDAPGAVSQVRTLGQAEEHAREAIAFVLGVAEDSFELTVVPELPKTLQAKVSRAKQGIRDLEALQREAGAMSREAVQELAAAGFKGREIAVVLGVSPQRVSQLAKGGHAGGSQRTAAAKERSRASSKSVAAASGKFVSVGRAAARPKASPAKSVSKRPRTGKS